LAISHFFYLSPLTAKIPTQAINSNTLPSAQISNDAKVISLKNKLAQFIEQYELREKHFLSVLQNQSLNSALSSLGSTNSTSTATHPLCTSCSKEIKQDKDQSLNQKLATYKSTIKDLKAQLSTYTQKFNKVEETLQKSNVLFLTFRKEMESMSEKTRRVEVENSEIREKFRVLEASMVGLTNVSISLDKF
jgi:chromosome segregation ATPase